MESPTPRPWTEAGRDPELLHEAQRGDVAALLQIVHAHRHSLWRACLGITRHRGESEILFQETLAHATRHLRAAPSGKPLLPWLVKLARQLDAAKQRGRGLRATVGSRRPNGEPWLAGSRGAHYVEDEQRALHAFALLHSEDQWLLSLRLIERLSYGDISRLTGIPLPRVMNRVALAREYIDATGGLEDMAA